jgi:hypothetical protein
MRHGIPYKIKNEAIAKIFIYKYSGYVFLYTES